MSSCLRPIPKLLSPRHHCHANVDYTDPLLVQWGSCYYRRIEIPYSIAFYVAKWEQIIFRWPSCYVTRDRIFLVVVGEIFLSRLPIHKDYGYGPKTKKKQKKTAKSSQPLSHGRRYYTNLVQWGRSCKRVGFPGIGRLLLWQMRREHILCFHSGLNVEIQRR